MTDRYLRYYAPTYEKDRHERWLSLLSRIKSKHGIRWEEKPTASQYGKIRKDWYEKKPVTDEKEIWEKELKRNAAIAQNDARGQNPSLKFKSRRNNFHIQGTITVVDSEHGVIHGERHDKATRFLKLVLEKGSDALDKLHAAGKRGKSTHKRLINAYEKQASGQTFRSFEVGKSLIEKRLLQKAAEVCREHRNQRNRLTRKR